MQTNGEWGSGVRRGDYPAGSAAAGQPSAPALLISTAKNWTSTATRDTRISTRRAALIFGLEGSARAKPWNRS